MTQLDTWNEVALPRIMLLRQRMEKDGDPAADYDRHMAEAASRCYVCDDRVDVHCVGCDGSLCAQHATQKRPKKTWRIEYWCDECLGDRPTPAPRSES